MKRNDAAVLSPEAEIAALEQEILDFKGQREAVMQQIRDFRATESRELQRSHAQEIFMLQQQKLRLDAEVDYREKKIRRIKYLNDESTC